MCHLLRWGALVDGHPGTEFTAQVPPRLYAKTGTHMLWVAGKGLDGNRITSNKVKIVAK